MSAAVGDSITEIIHIKVRRRPALCVCVCVLKLHDQYHTAGLVPVEQRQLHSGSVMAAAAETGPLMVGARRPPFSLHTVR